MTTGDGKVYRLDKGSFVRDERTKAPLSAYEIGRVGKEAWMIGRTSISRLAPK